MSELTEAGTPKPKRSWLQYSLRTFLLLVAVFSVWLGIQVNKAQKQKAVVAAIEAAGGEVIYDWQYLAWQNSLTLPGSENVPSQGAWLRKIVGEEYHQEIAVILIGYEHLSPEFCGSLRQFDTLQTVFVEGGGDLQRIQEALPGVEVLPFKTAAL